MAENATTKRLSKGQATEVTEKVTAPRRKPRTVAEQIEDIKAKGQRSLEKLTTRLGKQLPDLATTVRQIEAQRKALGMEPWATKPGRYTLEITDSGEYLFPERDEAAATPAPESELTDADTSTPGESEVKGSTETDGDA